MSGAEQNQGMPTTQCSECGGNVSTRAPTCPHCGTSKEAEPVTQRADLWTLYTSLKGRVSRKTFWLWFFVPWYIVSYIVSVLLSFTPFSSPWPGTGLFWLGITVGLVKRLHDRDKSGKQLLPYILMTWVVVPAMVVFVMAAIGPMTGGFPIDEEFESSFTGQAIAFVALYGGIVWSIWSIYLWSIIGFRRGTEGPNRYGPDPLQEPAGN